MNIYEEYAIPNKMSISNNPALESLQDAIDLLKNTYTSTNAGIAIYKILNNDKVNETLQEIKSDSGNKKLAKLITIDDNTLVIELVTSAIDDFLLSAFSAKSGVDLALLAVMLDRIFTSIPIQNVKMIINIQDTFCSFFDFYTLLYIIEPINGFFRDKDINVSIEYVGYNGLLSLFLLENVNSIKYNPFGVFMIDSEEYNDVLKQYEDGKIVVDYYFNMLKEKGILTSEEIDKITNSNETFMLNMKQIQDRFQQHVKGVE